MKKALLAALLLSFTLHPAQAADFATETLEATFKFFHADSTSTCFLVKRAAPDAAIYLVTTAHTVERTKGETAVLVLREAKEDGSYARHDHTFAIRRGEIPLWIRHAKEDVAVLKLEGELPVPVKPLAESALLDEKGLQESGVHICSPLFVLTYPQRFEANGAGFPVARQGIFASPPLLPAKAHPTYLGDFTTFAGDSGGPVFISGTDNHPRIAGIVIGQHHHEDRIKSDFEESTVKHSLGMGIILHASYLRETLAEAAKAK